MNELGFRSYLAIFQPMITQKSVSQSLRRVMNELGYWSYLAIFQPYDQTEICLIESEKSNGRRVMT